jgi:hypothetical protein
MQLTIFFRAVAQFWRFHFPPGQKGFLAARGKAPACSPRENGKCLLKFLLLKNMAKKTIQLVPTPFHKKSYFIFIVVVVLVALFLTLMLVTIQKEQELKVSNSLPQNKNNSPSLEEIKSAPLQLFSYVGAIKSISKNVFEILAKGDQNQLKEDLTVTVKVAEGTRFTQMALPTQSGEGGLTAETSAISFSNLKVGDLVLVSSAVDITGQTTIEASSVQKIK